MTSSHGAQVLDVYQSGLDTGDGGFPLTAPPWEVFDERYRAEHRYIAVSGRDVLGWVALLPFSPHDAYRGVAEVSVYVAARARRSGVGRALLHTVIDSSEAAGLWTLLAKIFPENTASIALHEAMGFVPMGTYERVGRRNGVWRDVVVLQRRSAVVGQD